MGRFLSSRSGLIGLALCVLSSAADAASNQFYLYRNVPGGVEDTTLPSSCEPTDSLTVTQACGKCRDGTLCDWSGQSVVSMSGSPASRTLAVGETSHFACDFVYRVNGEETDRTWSTTVNVQRRSVGTGSCSAGCTQGQVSQGNGTFPEGEGPELAICEGGCFKTLSRSYKVATFWNGAGPGVDSYLVNYEYETTGGICEAGGSTPPEPGGTPAPEGCATSAGGTTVCATEPGCGTVNGESMCVEKQAANCGEVNGRQVCITPNVEDNACVTTESGQVFCVSKSEPNLTAPPSPPAPDNGTAGQAAEPDVTMDSANGSSGGAQGHVYNSTTVNNSTNYGSDGDDGSGDGNGDGESSCGAPGQPKCSVNVEELQGSSTFTPPELAGPEGVESFGGELSKFQGRLEDSRLYKTFDGLWNEIPTGGANAACPTASFSVLGQPFQIDAHCDLVEAIRDLIGWFMYVVFGLVALRIVLSA